MPKNKERLNLILDQTLKRQFDAICALKGLSMSDIAHQVIKEWVEKNAPPGFLTTDISQPPATAVGNAKGRGRGEKVKDESARSQ